MARPPGRARRMLWASFFAIFGACDIALNLSMLVAVKGLDSPDLLNIGSYLALGALGLAAAGMVAGGKGPPGANVTGPLVVLSAGWLLVAALSAVSWAAWGFHDPLYRFLFGPEPPPGAGVAAWLGGTCALSLGTLFIGLRAGRRLRRGTGDGGNR